MFSLAVPRVQVTLLSITILSPRRRHGLHYRRRADFVQRYWVVSGIRQNSEWPRMGTAGLCVHVERQSECNAGPSDYIAGSPLVYLGVQQRISITVSTIEARHRFASSITAANLTTFYDDDFTVVTVDLLPDASDYILDLTNGHPRAVDSVLKMIQKVRYSHLFLCHRTLSN
ncbi:hypothetical protein FN846DRAFT_229495 [Sphaerosporella brunnea]|uniref:Uncharacterized protein n=1 Tax=Sphaerosporella brunnea TaxID=1250544 RepID=A0A5J5EMB0_9PEZI|nr:hypothetical protein FN846DRAFT_229495 [Sphaerosporella brunnea]